jgi:signal transduction histidine kinase
VPPPAIFGGEGRFLGHFERLAQPLSQYDMDMLTWFQTMPDAERAWLKELGVDLYVPVLLSDGPVALLALGPKAGARAYSEEDLETLTLMAHQTATAFKNTRLMDDLRAVQGDLRRLNVELSETNRQLMRLDRAKADFVTIASHELRTPLSQIFGYSDVLSSLQTDQLGDSPVFHEFVEGITRGARRLKDVVDAMVDMSLIETGGLTINCFLVSLSQVVKNAASVVEPRAQARAQTIAVEDLSALPNVEVDSARLQQVFESLLANAIKFSPDGGTITVSGRCDQDHIEVCVADQGIGIDPDHHDLVFEKFYRPENPLLHSTDDVAFKGAGPGLGLAIAKGIVEAHSGRIWVTSPRRDEERCPGSVFHVELPLVAGKAE